MGYPRTLVAVILLCGVAAAAPSQPAPPAPSPAIPPDEPLAVLEMPPRPARMPAYTELDPTTGLHVTGTVREIDASTWRLRVTGKVVAPLSLRYDELRRMPALTTKDPLVCRGYFEDYATWTGAALIPLLDLAGVSPEARSLRLVGADGYENLVSLKEARSGFALLAYEWNGKALPVLHGYPVRAAFPGLNGYARVKWLVAIEVE